MFVALSILPILLQILISSFALDFCPTINEFHIVTHTISYLRFDHELILSHWIYITPDFYFNRINRNESESKSIVCEPTCSNHHE